MVVPFEGASLRALFHVRQSDGAYLGKSKSAARFPSGAILQSRKKHTEFRTFVKRVWQTSTFRSWPYVLRPFALTCLAL